MQVKKLDHVNIHTANVDKLVQWYDRVLGMKAGDRPPFPFPGAWLYCGGEPTIHLLGVDKQPETTGLRLEHFAFSASGLTEFMGRLKRDSVRYDARKVPRSGEVQVNGGAARAAENAGLIWIWAVADGATVNRRGDR
jgi:catechol 2,3-dioxygenase-like lactoylglutathione lyase family enzyme